MVRGIEEVLEEGQIELDVGQPEPEEFGLGRDGRHRGIDGVGLLGVDLRRLAVFHLVPDCMAGPC